MSIIAARIDNRLLHGIVATQWVPEFRPQRLMVIDDIVANDPTKKAAMRMAKPSGVALSIINKETALTNYRAGKYDDHTVFIVARDPQTILDVIQTGQVVPTLVVGGTVFPEEGSDAVQVSSRAYVTKDELPAYRAIAGTGCDITVRYVPADKPVELSSIITLEQGSELMTPSIIQIAVVTLIAFIYGAEKNAGQILTNMSVTPAWFVGLALGDPVTGLAVGAIVQLMSLGVAAMGGASVPDYPTAAIIGAVVAITSGQEASVGVAAGIAVGMLGLQLDVIAKTANGFLGRTSQRFAEEGKYSQMKSVLFLGPVFYGLTAAIPTFAVLLFGADAVNAFLSVMPSWFTTGLSIAAGILPVVGLAMLLSFMPMKKFIAYAIVGFVLAAYLQISILPIALLGAAAAIEYYKSHSNPSVNALDAGGLEDE